MRQIGSSTKIDTFKNLKMLTFNSPTHRVPLANFGLLSCFLKKFQIETTATQKEKEEVET